MTPRCSICKREFDKCFFQNCGGDCLTCMCETGDPDAFLMYKEALIKHCNGMIDFYETNNSDKAEGIVDMCRLIRDEAMGEHLKLKKV